VFESPQDAVRAVGRLTGFNVGGRYIVARQHRVTQWVKERAPAAKAM
jgi:hypothetical protein